MFTSSLTTNGHQTPNNQPEHFSESSEGKTTCLKFADKSVCEVNRLVGLIYLFLAPDLLSCCLFK